MNNQKIKSIAYKIRSYGITDFFTIILALTSIYIAYVTSCALNRQTEIMLKGQQPIFNVKYDSSDWDNDGMYDTHTIKIYNEGHIAKRILQVNVRTFYPLRTIENSQNKLYQFEINGFYLISFLHTELIGEIHYAFSKGNHAYFCALSDDALHRSHLPETYYDVSKYDLIHIKYMDINDTIIYVYYKDSMPITDEIYKRLSDKTINDMPSFEVDKITLDDMLNYIHSKNL